MGPFRMDALFRFFSSSPLLQKIYIDVRDQIVQDSSLDQVILLESLVELDYTSNLADQILPFLRLPRLKRLRVISQLQPGQARTLADILPYGGRSILARATKMFYHSNRHAYSNMVKLSGNGVDVSFGAFCAAPGPVIVDWFSDQTCIPLEQIEDLKVEGGLPAAAGFPIGFFVLESLRVLRMALQNVEDTKELLCSLHPDPGAEVPCPSLQEIEIEHGYWGSRGPLTGLLISLVRERKRAGHQLRLVCLVVTYDSDQDLAEELREYVEEVRVRSWIANV